MSEETIMQQYLKASTAKTEIETSYNRLDKKANWFLGIMTAVNALSSPFSIPYLFSHSLVAGVLGVTAGVASEAGAVGLKLWTRNQIVRREKVIQTYMNSLPPMGRAG